ncbi:MAG: glycosyltransferase [Bacteroidota bacterium]
MTYFASITIIITGLYAGLLLFFKKGWLRLSEVNTQHTPRYRLFISVIIPFRNEAQNIENLVKDLHNQTFSPHHLEVIMVDDHSSDCGHEQLETLKKELPWLRLTRSKDHGKKAALQQGISAATGELIVTTDADCRFGKNWLQTIAETYIKSSPDMIAMPVEMKNNRNLFSRFQQLDYLALQMVTAGAFGLGKPILCSGANLAFKKKSYLEASSSAPGRNYLSGDDVFLLQAFKQHAFKIEYLKSAQAMVHTFPASTLSGFFTQRMRWGGKTPGYRDRFALQTALIVFATNVWAAALLLLAIAFPATILLWAGLIAIKTGTDWRFLNAGKRFFSAKVQPLHFLMFSLLYPFYITAAGIGSLLFKEKWKDRKGN